MTNDKLPREITEEIKTNAALYCDRNEWKYGGYIAGATAWAPWKVRHDELKNKGQKLADALEWIYTYGPGDATTIAFINKALSEWKDGKGKEVENEG